MKDKISAEKAAGPPDSKTEAPDELKREPGTMCENDTPGKNGDKTGTNASKGSGGQYLEIKPEQEVKEEDEITSSKIKTENMGDGSVLYSNDGSENLMLGPCNAGEPAVGPPPSTHPGTGTTGVQPLPSNVINKQPGTMEAQYMQQQSQIFVFSTSLANKAADSVLQGQFQSIIAYHCAQPGTKKYLEKHPLKLNQFNRQSPAQWLNTLAQFKQKTVFSGGPGAPPQHMAGKGGAPPGPMGPMPGPRMMGPGGPMTDLDNLQNPQELGPNREMHPDFPPINVWNQQGNMNHGNMGCAGPMRPMDRDKTCIGPRQPPLIDSSFQGMSQFTLTGTKVPTENLTPQQRQHREEQLATLRKMHQMLFPENQTQATDDFGNPRMMNVPPNPDCPPNGNANGPMQGRVSRPPLDGPMGSPMVNPPSGMAGSPILNPPNSIGIGSGEPGESHADLSPIPMQKMMGGNAVQCVAAQIEWQKLQHQFYEDRKKKGQRTESPGPRVGPPCPKMGHGMSGMCPQMQGGMPPMQGNVPPQMQGGMPPMPSMQGIQGMQGPPPPYHQTVRSASVPIAVPSPTPGSPCNTTSNLSLPSPRTSSDLNSPSDVNKMVKLATCSPPTNHGSPTCSKLPSSNPETPVSASMSPTSNKDMYSRGSGVSKIGKQASSCSKEPNLMPVPSPQQIQYLNTFEGQELTIQKQPNTSLKEPSNSSPLNHSQIAETPKCKTPNTTNNSPSQANQSQVPGPDVSPRYQQQTPTQAPQIPTSQHQPNSQCHSTGPSGKDMGMVPSSPSGPSPCRSENIPLNPNGVNCPPSSKAMHFDPITSLAQMSQQLTSQAPTNCQGPQFSQSSMLPMDQAMHMESMDSLPFVPQQGPQMMDMGPGFMNNGSPKPGMGAPPRFFGNHQFQRMMGPNTYNGMNVQVKASTPNTIQYLPARPSGNSPNPGIRNPPSLDFLQRFSNPNQEGKPPGMFMGNCHPSMEGPGPNLMMGGNMLRGQLRSGMKPCPPGIGKPPGPGGPVFDPIVMSNPGMFKGGPMGMPPEASQPLPPSMSQGNNFKNSPFVGPTIADPNYAQQFHNFQQQLYATNTRSQLNSHMNQSFFMTK